MQLFVSTEVNQYTSVISNKARSEIDKFSDQKIKTCDENEWIEYFYSKFGVEPIEIYEDNISQKMYETKIKTSNQWNKRISYEPEFYMLDGYCVEFSVPYDGSGDLLTLKPSTYIMTTFDVEDFITPTSEKCGSFVIAFSFTRQQLTEQVDPKSFVEKQFNQKFKNYKKMIGYVNAEICKFMASFKVVLKSYMEKRRNKAIDFELISEKLNIPLTYNNNAPNIAPISLQRRVRKPVIGLPQSKPVPKEYGISEFDFKNIVNIIHSSCSVMESTARTFSKSGEEELRDIIISTLGTHYVNQVTGETFRKVGKTDIHISFENKAAFIGECKIWHGIKMFEEAINQLFGYSTWKDSKVALIIFNKENKDFKAIRNTIGNWLKENTKNFSEVNANIWECVIYRTDVNEDINLSVMVYDVTV